LLLLLSLRFLRDRFLNCLHGFLNGRFYGRFGSNFCLHLSFNFSSRFLYIIVLWLLSLLWCWLFLSLLDLFNWFGNDCIFL
jgi:hypothetical protein